MNNLYHSIKLIFVPNLVASLLSTTHEWPLTIYVFDLNVKLIECAKKVDLILIMTTSIAPHVSDFDLTNRESILTSEAQRR